MDGRLNGVRFERNPVFSSKRKITALRDHFHIPMADKKKTVFVGMSGGVDSSVAALLLVRKGYRVVGVFMRSYNVDGCAERDAEDARRVAEHIGIPFYVWDFEEEYMQRVVRYMIEGYRSGITPNPDIMCNREIKFGLFLEKALAMGADYVATGHYVKMKRAGIGARAHAALFAAEDHRKDQSYFLWTLTQQQLAHCLFPIGAYTKPEVRAIARAAGLPTAEKKDSQGICFLGQVSIEDFLKTYIPEAPGAVVTADGTRIGTHRGVQFYTIGQRHIDAAFVFPKTGATGGGTPAMRKPFYVAAKNAGTNTLVVAQGADDPVLARGAVRLVQVSFVRGVPFEGAVMARVRYRQPLAKAVLRRDEADATGASFVLAFSTPQKFVAEGQSAVFYTSRGEMLGGGVIA
jgi:tRNA-specific 2-thiouridylase